MLADLYTGLTTLGPNGEIIAGVASSWTISPDHKTYVFKIRPDAYWQDGTPVTSRDFLLAFKRLFALGAKAKLSGVFDAIEGKEAAAVLALPITDAALELPFEGVKTLGPKSIQFQLTKPHPFFLDLLATSQAYPVPHHHYVVYGEAWAEFENDLGNGAYQFQRHTAGEQISLTRNTRFYDHDNVSIKTVNYVQIPRDATAARLVFSGVTDISPAIPHYQVEAVSGELDGFQLYRHQRSTIYSLLLNHNEGALKDVKVRRALYLAANRELIISVMNNQQTALRNLVPPTQGYKSLVPKLLPYENALKTAQALMQSAGYSADNMLKLTFRTQQTAGAHRLAIIVKRLWRRAYVDLTIAPSNFKTLIEDLYSGNFSVIRRSWNANYADPYIYLQIYTNTHNPAVYKTPDTYLTDIFTRADNNPTERQTHMQQAELYLHNKYYTVPIFVPIAHFLVADKVKGWSNKQLSENNSRWLQVEEKSMNTPR